MGVRINTNVEALNAQRNLGITAGVLAKSVEKLSSGLRINRAADDSAGLAISEKLRAQVRGLDQATRNAQDGISMIQTAEGALNEVHSILQRMRELAVQGANSTLTDTDRESINTELVALRAEVDRIASSTTFNGQKLLDGSLATSVSNASGVLGGDQVGTNSAVSKVDVSGAKAGTTYTIAQGTSGAGFLRMTATINGSVVTQDDVAVAAGTAGGSQVISFSTFGISLTVASSGADTAGDIEADLVTAGTVVTAAGSGAATFQIGANASDSLSVTFASMSVSALGIGTALTNFNASKTVGNANALITALDTAGQGLAVVSSTRASYGAVQNRLEHTVANLGVASENLAASESRIRDLDVAAEMVKFTKTQILQQAGTAILAQANQSPQAILALLR
jgi:flagellin